MKYFKLYLQTKEGKFFSYYQSEYSEEYEIGKLYTWKDMKIPYCRTKECEQEYPDSYWAPIFGVAKQEYCLPFLQGYFPVDDLKTDIEVWVPAFFREGMKPVIVECEGELWDIEESYYGKQEVKEWGPEDEIMFKSQTILNVVEEITREQIIEVITKAYEKEELL